MNIEEAIRICKEYFPIMDNSFSPQIQFFENEDKNYLSTTINTDKPYIMISNVDESDSIEMTMYDLKTIDENKLKELLERSKQSFINWN